VKNGASSSSGDACSGRFADITGRRDVMPTDAKARAKFVYRRPKWGRGMITEDDARFLHGLVVDVRPDVAVEVGVAAGCSSLHILSAMASYREREIGDTWLYSFDIRERCYFDESQLTGAAVAEFMPELRAHYRLTVGDVVLARQMLTGLHAHFAFIDANHFHPWAAADLLGLLPVLAPGAWVAVHDIRLPLLERGKSSRGLGPRHLFDQWPGEKRQGGADNNVGAIRLPENRADVERWLTGTFQQPWQVALPDEVCAALRITPRPISVIQDRDGLRVLQRAAGRQRPLYVCGSGQAARALAAQMRREALAVTAFLDRDAEPGREIDGLPVESRARLSQGQLPRPFLAVSGMYADDIDAELRATGWTRDEDYVVF
jgi:predicted O-methyltransferase YrrM